MLNHTIQSAVNPLLAKDSVLMKADVLNPMSHQCLRVCLCVVWAYTVWARCSIPLVVHCMCVCIHVCAVTHVCLYMAMCLCLRVCCEVCSRCGLLLCGWVVVYTIGTHNVARAHAPHCAAAESDFGLCPSLSLAGLLAHTTHRSNSGVS